MSLKAIAIQYRCGMKHYKLIRKMIAPSLADFCYQYILMKRKVVLHLLENKFISPVDDEWGKWQDKQIPNTYSHYADMVMENLLINIKPRVEEETDLSLIETYSYVRLYKKGDILKKHTDRDACEISVTLNLGGDPWALYLYPNVKLTLNPGDAVIYGGIEIEHWRKKFKGDICTQVFLHYNHVNGPLGLTHKYDKRPFLGLPEWFRQ